MKTLLSITVIFLLANYAVYGQDVKCDELISNVKKNNSFYQQVSEIQLQSSSWLKKVTSYFYENELVVIALIKQDQLGINSKEYIFCGVSTDSWIAFYFGLRDLDKTYGERFQKYIMQKSCDCLP